MEEAWRPELDDSSLALPEPKLDETWSKPEDKQFESMLISVPEECLQRFELISSCLPSKTVDQVVKRYHELVADVQAIEAGLFPFPDYVDRIFWEEEGKVLRNVVVEKSEKKRRDPGYKWTDDEHRLFIKGVKKYGQGDWRSISRHFVMTKTPAQVASHAQKFYLRHKEQGNSTTKRRKSIHDITLEDVQKMEQEE